MIAIGFVLSLIGFMGANASNNSLNIPGWVENIFVAVFLLGASLIVTGLFLLMWRYLP